MDSTSILKSNAIRCAKCSRVIKTGHIRAGLPFGSECVKTMNELEVALQTLNLEFPITLPMVANPDKIDAWVYPSEAKHIQNICAQNGINLRDPILSSDGATPSVTLEISSCKKTFEVFESFAAKRNKYILELTQQTNPSYARHLEKSTRTGTGIQE